jgi:hypothetical protein
VRVGGAILLLFLVGLLSACGGGDDTASEPATAAPGTLRALADAPGEDVALVMGTSDYEPGPVRVLFLVVDDQSRAVFSSAGARVWLSRALEEKPFAETTATLERIGVEGGATTGDVEQIYSATFQVDEPGKYFLLAEPVDAKPRIQGLANVVVAKEAKTPSVGEKAYPSRNPTVRDAPAEQISTQSPPSEELLRYTVAESLAARKPFVVAFATPKFCASRTCGPVVDVLDAVRKDVAAGDALRFIHVEIYEDNDPKLGTNRWVQEWNLPTEPWIFLVGRDGLIKAKFEGAVSVDELERAAREHLL